MSEITLEVIVEELKVVKIEINDQKHTLPYKKALELKDFLNKNLDESESDENDLTEPEDYNPIIYIADNLIKVGNPLTGVNYNSIFFDKLVFEGFLNRIRVYDDKQLTAILYPDNKDYLLLQKKWGYEMAEDIEREME